jgi:hypothetical protein
MFFFFFSISFSYFIIQLDPLAKFLNDADQDLITRARHVMADSTMIDIVQEDPQGQGEYHNAVRHQVVSTFQRLCLCLLVFDTLMVAYNSSK